MMDEDEYVTAEIPEEFKALRACLRCSLIKTFTQVRILLAVLFSQCFVVTFTDVIIVIVQR